MKRRLVSTKQGVGFLLPRLAPVLLCLCGWTAMPRAETIQDSPRAVQELLVSHRARSCQPGEIVVLEIALPSQDAQGGASRGERVMAASTLDVDRGQVESTSPLDIQEVRVSAFGRQASGYPRGDGVWEVMVGIDLAIEAGSYPVEIVAIAVLPGSVQPGQAATADSAVERRTEYLLKVEDKQFPTRRLKVAPKYVDPPQETRDRIFRESRLLRRLFEAATPQRLWSGEFTAPVPGRVNPDSFGKRSVFNGKPRSPHSGADFSAPEGTPVKAPNAGKVVLVRDLYFAGRTVIVDHGLGLYTYFAHLSQFKVEEGQTVERGDVLGLSGASGRVTGPHLHYSVRLNNAKVDPLALMEVLR